MFFSYADFQRSQSRSINSPVGFIGGFVSWLCTTIKPSRLFTKHDFLKFFKFYCQIPGQLELLDCKQLCCGCGFVLIYIFAFQRATSSSIIFSYIYELPPQNKSLLPTYLLTYLPTYIPREPPAHSPTYLPTYLPVHLPVHLPMMTQQQ